MKQEKHIFGTNYATHDLAADSLEVEHFPT